MDSLRVFVATLMANVAGLLLPIRNEIYGLVLLFAVLCVLSKWITNPV